MPRHDRRYAYGPYTDGPDPLAPPVDLRTALVANATALDAWKADTDQVTTKAAEAEAERRAEQAVKVKADADGFALSDDYKKVDVEAIKAAL